MDRFFSTGLVTDELLIVRKRTTSFISIHKSKPEIRKSNLICCYRDSGQKTACSAVIVIFLRHFTCAAEMNACGIW